MVIMEENKGYTATLGTCSADPYLCSLASKYASATAWYGVTHPSQPNYTAFDSGSTQGCTADDCVPAYHYTVTDLGGQLTAKGIPWIAYMESMPSACFTGNTSGSYALKHNPFILFDVPYPGDSAMLSTLDGANPPDFVWITPNLNDDMHDGTVQQGDAWLQANLPNVLTSPWFADNGTVIVTMDEGDGQPNGPSSSEAGGHIPMVVISANALGKGAVTTVGDHYGTLRSIEEAYGLSLLGNASTSANGDLFALFG
jgi:phosphatidylinositol-3-phosphatase